MIYGTYFKETPPNPTLFFHPLGEQRKPEVGVIHLPGEMPELCSSEFLSATKYLGERINQ